MSGYRGCYRTHHKTNAAKIEDKRGCPYVESPARLAKEFEAALERKRRELDEQREQLKRVAAARRGVK
jgi:hypothetical protein